MPKIIVCKDCEERHTACHDHCEKYKQAKAAMEDRKKQIEDGRKKDKEYEDYKRKRHKKWGQK